MIGGRDARVLCVAVVLGAAAVVAGGSPIGHDPVDRGCVLAGASFLGLGFSMLTRRGFAAELPLDQTAPFAVVLDRLLRGFGGGRWRSSGLAVASGAATVAGGTAVHSLSAIVAPSLALGAFAGLFATVAIFFGALLRVGIDGIEFDDRSFGTVFGRYLAPWILVLQSILAIPHLVSAWKRHRPLRRVRFEIGGLGTRVEDMTPPSARDHGVLPALFMMSSGAALIAWGGGAVALGVGGLAVLCGPAFAALTAQAGSPLVVAAILIGTRWDVHALPFLVVAAMIALATDAHRLGVLRSASPRSIDHALGAGALVAAIGVVAATAAPAIVRDLGATGRPFRILAIVGSFVLAVAWIVAWLREDEEEEPRSAGTEKGNSSQFARAMLWFAPGAVVLGLMLPALVGITFVIGGNLRYLLRIDRETAEDSRFSAGGVCAGMAAMLPFVIGWLVIRVR